MLTEQECAEIKYLESCIHHFYEIKEGIITTQGESYFNNNLIPYYKYKIDKIKLESHFREVRKQKWENGEITYDNTLGENE